MRQELHLYIEDREVEFNQPPEILYNYIETEMRNPTVVKNSYSKTLTIEGTPNNNDIFGHIWNLEKYQVYTVDYQSGAYFDPLAKAKFTLYLNGEVYESGYVKLDEVRRNGHNMEYDITLYGGIGSFFYNLSFSKDENGEVEGPDILTLADLQYDGIDDVSFEINKNTVYDAWHTLMGDPDAVYDESEVNRPENYLYDEKWRLLNFAPCYNGKPEDFDSDKVAINIDGYWWPRGDGYEQNYFTDVVRKADDKTIPQGGDKEYKDRNGYLIGTTSEEMTEWESFDLRSYNQRPVVNMKKVIEACCNPVNNGGYEVDLDEHFFNFDNPYYEEAWMTLPMLRDLDVKKTKEDPSIKTATLRADGDNTFAIDFPTPTINDYTNAELNLSLGFSYIPLAGEEMPDYLYLAHYIKNKRLLPPYYFNFFGAILLQMVAYDENDNVVQTSPTYYLHTAPTSKQNGDFKQFRKLWSKISPDENRIVDCTGFFKKNANENSYNWCDVNGTEVGLKMSMTNPSAYRRIELKYADVQSMVEALLFLQKPSSTYLSEGLALNLYKTKKDSVRFYGDGAAFEKYDRYSGNLQLIVNSFTVTAYDLEGMFSGTRFTKKDLLTTDKSPCDYLLSYAKLFGLYFFKNPSEDSEREDCPNGVIHIMDRETFYHRDEIVDLEKLIDRSKPMKITPQIADCKWYDFSLEMTDSESNEDFKKLSGGLDYGTKRINTNYSFDASNKALLDGNAYKGAVEVLEKDKYYTMPTSDLPFYNFNGFTLTTYKKGKPEETEERAMPVTVYPNLPINKEGLAYYDAFSKPQFHMADNEASDGDSVLLFFNGWEETEASYWLTDDLQCMIDLNDSNPCWVLTATETDESGMRIAYKVNNIPQFGRSVVNGQSHMWVNSWDLGYPNDCAVTYIPDEMIGEDTSIYSKCWRRYIADMYDTNTRLLNCYCILQDKPNPEWLRRFYWFDNSIWRLNKISDWNISSYDTTNMEFIKVQDLDNYSMVNIDNNPDVRFTFNLPQTKIVDKWNGEERYYRVKSDGGDFIGSIFISDGGAWAFGDGANAWYEMEYEDGTVESYPYASIITPSEDYGLGSSERVFHIPENNTAKKRTFKFNIVVYGGKETWCYCYIEQSSSKEESLTVTPTSLSVPSSGGTYTVKLYYGNRNGHNVTIDHNEEYDYISWGEVNWEGNDGIVNVTVDANETDEVRNQDYVQFMTYRGIRKSLSVTQAAAPSLFQVSNFMIRFTHSNQNVWFSKGASYLSTLQQNPNTRNPKVTVTMGGLDITRDSAIDNGDGTWTISIASITGDVTISATAELIPEEEKVSVTLNLTGCTSDNNATMTVKGNAYTANIEADLGYTLKPSVFSIFMGTTELNASDVVSYVRRATYAINIPNVTDNLSITVTAIKDKDFVTPDEI